MSKIRVPLVVGIGGIQAAVPTGRMSESSFTPLIPGKVTKDGILAGVSIGDPQLANVTVEVDVPDDDLTDDKTALDPVKLRKRYPGHFLEGKVWQKA